MLQRPEYNTREHILLWLAGKSGTFYWRNPHICACAQYQHAHDRKEPWVGSLNELNDIGRQLYCDRYSNTKTIERDRLLTFVELYEAACKAWGR
jgi:hypothetical protein